MGRKIDLWLFLGLIFAVLVAVTSCISPVMIQIVNTSTTTMTPTNTAIPSTDTPLPPTNTPLPPTETPIPPTDNPIPATSTNTPPAPTQTAEINYFFVRIDPEDGSLEDQLAEQARIAGKMGLTPVVGFDAPW